MAIGASPGIDYSAGCGSPFTQQYIAALNMDAFWWLVLEAVVAVALLVGIVLWTMRGRKPDDAPGAGPSDRRDS